MKRCYFGLSLVTCRRGEGQWGRGTGWLRFPPYPNPSSTEQNWSTAVKRRLPDGEIFGRENQAEGHQQKLDQMRMTLWNAFVKRSRMATMNDGYSINDEYI